MLRQRDYNEFLKDPLGQHVNDEKERLEEEAKKDKYNEAISIVREQQRGNEELDLDVLGPLSPKTLDELKENL